MTHIISWSVTQCVVAAASVVVVACAALSLLSGLARAWLDRSDPYVAERRYRYVGEDPADRKRGHDYRVADLDQVNRIGKRRFAEIVQANERVTVAARLSRRLALVCGRRRA